MNSRYIVLVIMIFFINVIVKGQETYIDNFNSGSYSNNSGTANFSTSWVETNETTDPSSGRISIQSNQLRLQNLDDREITRTLDLSGAISGTLTFTYNRTDGNERVDVQLFDGTAYSTITTLNGSGSLSYSLNPSQLSANSGIRFKTGSGGWSGSETMLIDNVMFNIQYPTTPPEVTGYGYQRYCRGSSKPIVESISITDVDNTSTDAVHIQISTGYVNGEDLLTLIGSHPNITASWDALQGKLSLVGPATYTEFETAISAVNYSSTSANPSGIRQFSITVGEANYLPTTQHYYEFVAAPGITWTVAETAAASRTYYGLQGYLATLTSQQEADFSGSQALGVGWIGATDAAVEGEWRWVTGPEAGTQFWSGGVGGTELTFAFWNNSEPNDFPDGPSTPGQENYAHITDNSVGVEGSWNDLPNTGGGGAYAAQGYVVEYGGMTGDPVINVTLTTTLIMGCSVITNRNITFRVKRN
ncbi:C-type lectin domain-containing protein [Maribacter sp. CXY002]|uniref:C-type lectin domain-containing protein n=1 Tax=Maribacter luteocoastalis TaxID=3407671 RepID=UPI003B66CB80